MSDFAAAAMMRLIPLGLRRQGIAAAALKPSCGAHVPLADKRALADALLREHGAPVLLRIGQAVHDARDEPILVALMMARDPLDLIARWQRLEGFVHSRHRVFIEHAGADNAVLRHVSLDTERPPSRAEDLLVFGLLVAFIERLGTDGLQARFAGDSRRWWQHGRWIESALPKDVSCWALNWSPGRGARPLAGPVADDGWVGAAHCVLCADPGRHWTLPALARDLNTSPRSLQRRLLAGGSGFSGLLLEVRLAQSAKLLADSQQSPAEIGYVCGFSDQAHFTRRFKGHSALTPGQFRAKFAVLR